MSARTPGCQQTLTLPPPSATATKLRALSAHQLKSRGHCRKIRTCLNGQYLYFTWSENFGEIWVMDVVYQLAIHAPVVDARIRPRQPGSRTRRTRSRSRILPTSVPGKAGCTWPSSSICFRVRVIGWAVANHLRTDLARSARQRESHETRRKLLQEERGCLIKLSTTAGQAQL